MTTLIRWWYRFWIFLLYPLRNPANRVQRWLVERDQPSEPLPILKSLQGIFNYIDARFDWRPDATRLGGLFVPLDYISHPETFQARLSAGVSADGDCDDYAMWVATMLRRLQGGPVLLLSVIWRGGGHTGCVWYDERERLWLIDYGITSISHSRVAVELVLERYAKGRPAWAVVWEIVDSERLRLLANGAGRYSRPP